MQAREYPKAIEAERALLGGLIVDPGKLDDIADRVSAKDFYVPHHGALYALLLDMRSAGHHIDMVTVPEQAARKEGGEPYGGLAYVIALPDATPSTANLTHYAEVVRRKSGLRRLITATQTFTAEAFAESDEPEVLAERATQAILDVGSAGKRSWMAVGSIVDDEVARIERLAEVGTAVSGVTTGYGELDNKLAGFHPTDLVVLAARPAMGKTALALNLALNVALLGGGAVGVFSLEMGRGQLTTRLLSILSGVSANALRTGMLKESDWDPLLVASDTMRGMRVFLDDTPGVTLADVRARARRLLSSHPDVSLIVIDYLQLMQGDDPKANRQQQISDISRGLKILAKDLNVTVLALSQLNRAVEQRADKRPMVSDLRESGAIEQDADVIMFIYRDEIYNPDTPDKGLAEIIVAKQRNGPTGTVKLAFDGAHARFDNVETVDLL